MTRQLFMTMLKRMMLGRQTTRGMLGEAVMIPNHARAHAQTVNHMVRRLPPDVRRRRRHGVEKRRREQSPVSQFSRVRSHSCQVTNPKHAATPEKSGQENQKPRLACLRLRFQNQLTGPEVRKCGTRRPKAKQVTIRYGRSRWQRCQDAVREGIEARGLKLPSGKTSQPC